jgi:RNA polymerase sigma factor (sigma-70 family)
LWEGDFTLAVKKLTQEEEKALVIGLFANDKEAHEKFIIQYDKVVHTYCHKYFNTVKRLVGPYYDYDDIYQHLWYEVLLRVPKFDSSRAGLTTWFYLICGTQANMLIRKLKKCDISDENLEDIIYNDGDGGDMDLMGLIADPASVFEDRLLYEGKLYDYMYLIKGMFSKLSALYKNVYWHFIKDLTQRDSAEILGISQSYVARIRQKVMIKAVDLWQYADTRKIDHEEALRFTFTLLSNLSDDDVSDQLNCELSVIKVCRHILTVSDIYKPS